VALTVDALPCRPGERRDPPLGARAFSKWVPAFAGTT
jgi:hypothetical protein